MTKWFGKQSLFVKTFMLLSVSALLFAFMAFNVLSSEIKREVSEQTSRHVRQTLNVANTQLQNKFMHNIAILLSLRTNENFVEALSAKAATNNDRHEVAEMLETVVTEAYYILDELLMVAIVSSHGDVYANWSMYDSVSLERLYGRYVALLEEGVARPGILHSEIFTGESVTLLESEDSLYVQFMPLLNGKNELVGAAMVIVPEKGIYAAMDFGDDSAHTTFLEDGDGIIVSAKDKSLLGTPLELAIPTGEGIINRSDRSGRTLMMITDIMPDSYISRQTDPILARTAAYIGLTIALVLVVYFFIMRSITRPLVKLTRRMVNDDYFSFLHDRAASVGRNELLLLEGGFEVMCANIRSLISENAQKEQEKRRTEIEALQAQIQPHFLFNTLNTIRSSILNNRGEKAADLLVKLTMLLRMTLIKGDEMITVSEEIETVRYYLGIIGMRHNANFIIKTDISPLTEVFLLPKLLLQPVVENCVVHGFLPAQQGGEIDIHVYVDGDFWYIDIINDGRLIDKEIDLRNGAKRDSFSGMGTVNVDRRLKLYYGESSGLRVYPSEGRTTTRLTIALHPSVENDLTGLLNSPKL
ncbi:MAG: sensor histidine kinase [Clostridiales bacterium]|jgi:two-component system sensor histidine kinase YesM|nr:sensor histidine kinase [Clostridiales bacterium]